MVKIVGIRFKQAGKIYHFNAGDIEMAPGDEVVVKTVRGVELGRVETAPADAGPNDNTEELSPVLRKANEDDIAKAQQDDARSTEALAECEKLIAD